MDHGLWLQKIISKIKNLIIDSKYIENFLSKKKNLLFFQKKLFSSFSGENFYKNLIKFEKRKNTIVYFNTSSSRKKKILEKKFHLELEGISFGLYLVQWDRVGPKNF